MVVSLSEEEVEECLEAFGETVKGINRARKHLIFGDFPSAEGELLGMAQKGGFPEMSGLLDDLREIEEECGIELEEAKDIADNIREPLEKEDRYGSLKTLVAAENELFETFDEEVALRYYPKKL